MDYLERRISRMMKLASTNLTIALTMISIEAGLLAFVFTFYPKGALDNTTDLISFILYEGGPVIWISAQIIKILRDILVSAMILLIIFSIFSFTFCFLYSHDALEVYATAPTREGIIMPEDTKHLKQFYRRGLFGLKLGVSLLLGFVLSILIGVVYTLFSSLLLPTILVVLFAALYICFLILLWMKTVTLKA